jgi:hypothetical protein
MILFGLMSLMAALGSKRAREPVQDLQVLLMLALAQGVRPEELHRQLVAAGTPPAPGPWNEAVSLLEREAKLALLAQEDWPTALRMGDATGASPAFVAATQAHLMPSREAGDREGRDLGALPWLGQAVVQDAFRVCPGCMSPDLEETDWIRIPGTRPWRQDSPNDSLYCSGCGGWPTGTYTLRFSEPVTLVAARELAKLAPDLEEIACKHNGELVSSLNYPSVDFLSGGAWRVLDRNAGQWIRDEDNVVATLMFGDSP